MEAWAADKSAEFETKIVPMVMDVTDTAAVKAGLMTIHKTEGHIDVVVNNAAIIQNQKLGMVTKPLLEKMFAVNVFAVIDMMQIASRLMARTGGGSIVNIASVTGVVGSLQLHQGCCHLRHKIGGQGTFAHANQGERGSAGYYPDRTLRGTLRGYG